MTGRPIAIATLVAALGGGCGKPHNGEIGLKGVAPLPALVAPRDTTQLSGAVSVRGLDRRSWAPIIVGVPINQVDHYPTYVGLLGAKDPSGVWDPVFPTAPGALDDGASPGEDLATAAVEPAYSALLLLYAPVDMILGRWPWETERSPGPTYARMPRPGESDLERWLGHGRTRVEWSDDSPQ